jgi:hypothetical protein
MVADRFASRALRRAAKLRQALSSVAPVACGYARSLRPSLARFSQPASTICSSGGEA